VEAHKVVLAAASPFFLNILGQHKHPHPLIYMRGVTSEDMVAILDLIYLGEANVYQENLNFLLVLADELKLKGLNNRIDQEVDHDPLIFYKQEKTNNKKSEEFDIINTFHSTHESINRLQAPSDSPEAIKTTTPSDPLIFVDAEVLKAQVKSMYRLGGPGRRQSKLVCTVCGKEGEYNIIKYHIEVNHIQGVSLPCSVCNMTFRSNKRLLEHNTSHKKIPENVDCDNCGRIFNRRRNLKTHLLKYKNGECKFRAAQFENNKSRKAVVQKSWNLPEKVEKESSGYNSEEALPTTPNEEKGAEYVDREKKASNSEKEKDESIFSISEYIDIDPFPKKGSSQEIQADPSFKQESGASGGMEELGAQIRSMIGKGESMGRHQRNSACTVCGKEGDYNNIKYHIEITHIQGISLPCTVCNMTFKSRKRLRVHSKLQHSITLELGRPGRPRSKKDQDGNN